MSATPTPIPLEGLKLLGRLSNRHDNVFLARIPALGRSSSAIPALGRSSSAIPALGRSDFADTCVVKRESYRNKSTHTKECLVREVNVLVEMQSSKHVVRFIGKRVNRDTETLDIITEYYPQGSLEGRFLGDDIGKILFQIASAIRDLHSKGYIHQDIKPANILLDQNNNAKLADFGLVYPMSYTGSRTLRGGTRDYMSPNVIRDLTMCKQHPDPKDDVWSFGVTAFQLVYGYLPFPLPEGAATPTFEGSPFDELIKRCLNRKTFGCGIDEVIEMLKRFGDGDGEDEKIDRQTTDTSELERAMADIDNLKADIDDLIKAGTADGEFESDDEEEA